MTLSLSCKKCKSALRAPEKLAGKTLKCPRCAAPVVVPAEQEEYAAVEVERRVQSTPVRKAKPRHDEEEEDDARSRDHRRGMRPERSGDRSGVSKRRRAEHELPDEPEADEKGSRFKRCPRCGCRKAHRIKWTAWGSFYGPALFTHVRCRDCGAGYNGKTGRSNLIPAIIFVSVPLLGILTILGVIFYTVASRLNGAVHPCRRVLSGRPP